MAHQIKKMDDFSTMTWRLAEIRRLRWRAI